jgi:hypothetical protein
MLAQIALEFPSLPDLLKITPAQIRFFYNAIRNGIAERAAQKRQLERLLANQRKR